MSFALQRRPLLRLQTIFVDTSKFNRRTTINSLFIEPTSILLSLLSLHTIAVKLLNETEWSTGGHPPRFAFFREAKFTAKFQFGNDLCTLQRSALLYAQYYFVEYFLRDLELNVVAKLPGRNDARVAGEHRIDVRSAVDHFNNYLANGLPIAAHFLELRRGPRRTLAATLLAYVQSDLGDSRARVRAKADPMTEAQATAARLCGDKALIVFGRLDSLVDTK